MDRTIVYGHEGEDFKLRVYNPYTERLAICVNDIICRYVSPEEFVEDPDRHIHAAIDRYKVEKDVGLI